MAAGGRFWTRLLEHTLARRPIQGKGGQADWTENYFSDLLTASAAIAAAEKVPNKRNGDGSGVRETTQLLHVLQTREN
jgi:hypothetical protein